MQLEGKTRREKWISNKGMERENEVNMKYKNDVYMC